jgi:molybdopterin synthase sulfur carrier subunit
MARILYFAQLVDLLGRASEEVTLPDSARDVRGLLAWLRSRGGNWERLLGEDAVRVTIDRQFGDLDSALCDANEIALINSRRL